jgi:DNA-binding NarL/FixJ family response regulator
MSTQRILLADDHQPLLDSVRHMLEPVFEIVGTAHNGREMISQAERLKPDVIVADIGMPELDGLEAARELRERGSTAKLVFLTIHSEPRFVQACVRAGALGYVVKAHMWTDLIPAIEAAAAGRSFISPTSSH